MSNTILIKLCISVLIVHTMSILKIPDRRGQLMLLNLEIIDVIHDRKLVGLIGIVYMRSPVCVLCSLIINSYQSNFH